MAKRDKSFSRSLEYTKIAKALTRIHIPDHLKQLIDIENISRIDLFRD